MGEVGTIVTGSGRFFFRTLELARNFGGGPWLYFPCSALTPQHPFF